jgi:hypothetical protein
VTGRVLQCRDASTVVALLSLQVGSRSACSWIAPDRVAMVAAQEGTR